MTNGHDPRALRIEPAIEGQSREFVGRLRHFGGDRIERTGQICAKRGDHADNGNSNASSDKAIFNGGRAGFVIQKAGNEGHGMHSKKLRVSTYALGAGLTGPSRVISLLRSCLSNKLRPASIPVFIWILA